MFLPNIKGIFISFIFSDDVDSAAAHFSFPVRFSPSSLTSAPVISVQA